jgi:hypothetical protein
MIHQAIYNLLPEITPGQANGQRNELGEVQYHLGGHERARPFCRYLPRYEIYWRDGKDVGYIS